jgi:hypothetical protein
MDTIVGVTVGILLAISVAIIVAITVLFRNASARPQERGAPVGPETQDG